MSHTITWKTNGFIRTFTDEVLVDEIMQSNFELLDDPKFQEAKYIINDFTQLTECYIKTAHTKIFASTDDIISRSKGRFMIAIVANHASIISLANNYRDEMKNNIFKCEIFHTVDEALNWASS